LGWCPAIKYNPPENVTQNGVIERRRAVHRGTRACARVERGRPGLIRGCLSHTSGRCPNLLSGCGVVCGGDNFRPLHLETATRRLRLGQSALTRGPAAPAAELSPAATTCAAAWHSVAVLLPAPSVRPGKTKLTWVVPDAALKTFHRHHTSSRHSRVIILHACIA
jgi:hypothetical protein